ncbi:MAG: hypothetical protein H5T97_13455, partial [Firmicutes bacterium]|nr:hypothetical protein [Bacillota bacterium]
RGLDRTAVLVERVGGGRPLEFTLERAEVADLVAAARHAEVTAREG